MRLNRAPGKKGTGLANAISRGPWIWFAGCSSELRGRSVWGAVALWTEHLPAPHQTAPVTSTALRSGILMFFGAVCVCTQLGILPCIECFARDLVCLAILFIFFRFSDRGVSQLESRIWGSLALSCSRAGGVLKILRCSGFGEDL